AQEVVITQILDSDLDPRTFRLGDFGWGGMIFSPPENRASINEQIDLTASHGYVVNVSAFINVSERTATWTISTLDPATGDLPLDALVGFLPPNDEEGIGEGFVSYRIRALSDAATGEVVDAVARIIFDTEEPIDTPPIFNTLDALAPASQVSALPDTAEGATFNVSWSGQDDTGGSALAGYTIYVSQDGGDY